MKALRAMCRYIGRHPVLWLAGLVLPPVFALAAQLIYAQANRHVVSGLADTTATSTTVLMILGAALLGMITAELLRQATRYLFAKFVILTESDVRQALYEKLLGNRWSDLTAMNSGDLFTRYNQDTTTAVATISEDLFSVIYPLILGTGYCVAIFLTNRVLGALTTFLVIVVIALNTYYVNRYQELEREKRARQEEFAMEIDSVLQGKMSLRMMSVGDRMARALARSSDSIARNETDTILLDLKRALTMNWFATLCTTMVLPIACLMASLGRINLPNVIFVAQLSGTLIAQTRSFGLSITRLGSNLVSARRLHAFLDLPGEVLGQRDAMRADPTQHVLRLDGVSFSYGDTCILEDAAMCVNQGEIVALVGPSGSGKSSIAKAILRLVDYSGQIRLWGKDISECSLASLRSSIAYVPENNDLMDGTVIENVTLGHPGADVERMDASIQMAMESAALGEFACDHGFETRDVGERGSSLSGGQRQRVAIARAFVKDAPILLMDEPTASLDSVSEALVLEKLREMSRSGKSILLITHRESTLRIADRIIMVEGKTLRSDVSLEEALEALRREAVHGPSPIAKTVRQSSPRLRAIAG
jgi:ATP-binding cassette, subfamily B, bacterial